MPARRHIRSFQLYLSNNLPEGLISKFNCLALEERRIGEVDFNEKRSTDFISAYKRKLKDDFLAIEFKVRVFII